MSQLLLPGEVLHVPGLIEPDRAIRFGAAIRPLCEAGARIDMSYFIATPGSYTPGEALLDNAARADLEAMDELVEATLAGQRPRERYVVATHMNSPIRRFAWHVDPDFDIRPIINLGEEETSILLSRSRGTMKRDPQNIYLDMPPDESDQVELTLQPGDAYFLDNRVDRADRMPHSTPPDSLGRLMLRYNYIYPSYYDDPIDFSQFENVERITMLEPAA